MAGIRDYGSIISPALRRVTLRPGEEITGEFTYTNAFYDNSPDTQTFSTMVKFVFQQNGEPLVLDTTPSTLAQYDMSSWIIPKEKTVTLKKGESTKIHYTIQVPANPAPGGKYGTIVLAKTADPNEPALTGARLSGQVGFVLLGKMGDSEIRNSEVISFTSDHYFYFAWPNDPIIFTVVVKNTGNVDYLPGGNIFIHSGNITQPIKTLSVNPNNFVLLPENQRVLTIPWQERKTFIDTKSEQGIFINPEYFRIGRYIATAKIGYDLDGKRLTADKEVIIWILPIHLLIAILVLFIITCLVLVKWILRRKKTTQTVTKPHIDSTRTI